MSGVRSGGGSGRGGASGDQDDIRPFLADRAVRYVELLESANAKLSARAYRADDLVDDWFRGVGLVVQDMTAAVTLLARAAEARSTRPAPPSRQGRG